MEQGRRTFQKLFRTVIGVVVGYAIMNVLITLVQESWFGGVGWHESPLDILAIAGFLTCVAAAIGAIIATAIALLTGRVSAFIISSLIVAETTALTALGKLSGPLWFDILAAASLIAAILVGTELYLRIKHRIPAVRGM